MANITMKAKDTISAKLAECYVTIGDNRYNLMNAKNLEAKFEKKKTEVPILGRTANGNKASGWKGSGSATIYYNTSIFRQAALDYKNSGEDMYYDIQITNEDPTSSAGKQTIILKDVNFDSLILAKFDATSDDPLDEDVDFTFEDFDMPDSFTLLDGMLSA